MVTREVLTDANLTDMAKRIAQQGEIVILSNGGRRVEKNGKEYYLINSEASFTAPFEKAPPSAFSERASVLPISKAAS